MSIISDYKGAVDIDITTKVAAASVTPTIVGTAFKDLADILDSYLGGTLPADYDSLFKVGTRLGTIDSLLGSSGVTIDQINTAISDLASDISSLDTNKVDKVLNKSLVSDTEILRLSTVANYVHPTTDGNKHVPANGTTNDGKALVSGSVAGTYTWSVVADLLLTGYTKAASVVAIAATTSIRGAIGILEKALDGKANLDPVTGKVALEDMERDDISLYFGDGIEQFDSGEVDENSNPIMHLRVSASYLKEQSKVLLIKKRFGWWKGRYSDTNIDAFNTSSPTSSGGTIASVALDPTTYYGRLGKVRQTASVTTANTQANIRDAKGVFTMQEGFDHDLWFSPIDVGITDKRSFWGLTDSSGALSVSTQPSAIAHSTIAIANDSSDTNLQILSGPSGALQKINLGSNFPKTMTDLIRFQYRVEPGAISFTYTVSRYSKSANTLTLVGSPVSGTSTDVPGQTTALGRQLFCANGSTTGIALSFEFCDWEFESVSDVI